MPETACHGDVFHIQRQFGKVLSGLIRQAQGATARRLNVEQQMAQANLTAATTRKLVIQQVKATRREAGLLARVEAEHYCSGSHMMYSCSLALS